MAQDFYVPVGPMQGVQVFTNTLVGSPVAPFSPNQLANLQIWYRGDKGISLNGSTVSAWADQSGVGDVHRNATQSTALNQPTYNASDPAYNGQATLSFASGSSNFMVASPFATPVAGVTTTFMVMDSDMAAREFFLTTNGGNSIETIPPATYADNLGVNVSVTSPSVIIGVYRGSASSNSAIYVNSKSPLLTGNAGADISFNTIWLASNVGSGFFQNGRIAELIIYDRVLSSTELSQVQTYLSARYGITLS